MAYWTAEEARNRHIEQMGEALGIQFAALWQEVAHLHMKWAEYVELFGSKSTRIELLNQVAPAFFGMIQYVLLEETLLHIARLTDPPKSMGRANLTIKNLPELVNDPMIKITVEALVETVVSKTKFCRDWRNRHLAHRDLDLAMDKSAKPLKTASRKQVNEALNAIAEVLNVVSVHYAESEILFEGNHSAGGAVSLLYVLDDGIRAQAGREERMLRGEISKEGYPRDL